MQVKQIIACSPSRWRMDLHNQHQPSRPRLAGRPLIQLVRNHLSPLLFTVSIRHQARDHWDFAREIAIEMPTASLDFDAFRGVEVTNEFQVAPTENWIQASRITVSQLDQCQVQFKIPPQQNHQSPKSQHLLPKTFLRSILRSSPLKDNPNH